VQGAQRGVLFFTVVDQDEAAPPLMLLAWFGGGLIDSRFWF